MLPHDWAPYYIRTLDLPPVERFAQFLECIPPGGRILDFGAGSGRWALAFHQHRPDIIIDVLDQNIHLASLLPSAWLGEKISADFEHFIPTIKYDGIWAFAVFFFLEQPKLQQYFAQLTDALRPGGVMQWSMVDECPEAISQAFYGMSDAHMQQMLLDNGMELIAPIHRSAVPYGLQKTRIPTSYLRARKRKNAT